MANRLVEHLRERGRTAVARFAARWLGPVSPAQWRRAVVLLRTQPVGRIATALTAAFACGIVLGVGVAALITPQRAAVVAGALDIPGKDRISDAVPYAVAVRVREEGRVRPDAAGAATVTLPTLLAPPVETAAAPAVLPAKPAVRSASEAAVAALPSPRPQVQIPHVQVPLPAAPPPGDVAAEAGQAVPGEHPSARPEPPVSLPAPRANGPLQDGVESVAEAGPAPPATPLDPAPQPATQQLALNLPLPPRPAPRNPELAALPMPRDPAWIRNAVKVPDGPHGAAIAIIVDDMGIDQKRSRLAIGLPAPLTLSFIPYGYHLPELVAAARAAGHEVMLHMPMEPLDTEADPGPNALRTTVSIEENRNRLLWAFGRFDGIVGLNNHMGSKFTTWAPGMEMVLREAQARGLLFVDSITNNESVGYRLAHARKLPSASRDVFIDHDITTVAIVHSLQELERVARRKGYAVGIAHPHDLTRELLKRWIVEAKARGIDFVPISFIAQRAMKTG
jgi:polysaccharide deacetylase 2 family uncharacterized protein YibQ